MAAPLLRHPIHDVAASTAALARSWLISIDRKSLETSVPTQTLILGLETIVQQSTPQSTVDLAQSARRAVLDAAVEVTDAIRARDEDEDRRRTDG